MTSVRIWGRLGVATLTFAVLVASQGCSKSSSDYGLGNTQGDNFSNPDRSAKIEDLKGDYNANIVVADQSYADEHEVNNVLRYLAKNEGSLKGQLQNVVEIDIVNSGAFARGAAHQGAVQWAPVGETDGNTSYKIMVNDQASATDLDAGFQKFANSYQGTALLDAAGARVGVKIVDMVGLSSNDAKSFGDNLVSAASGLDFTTATAQKYATTIQIDNIFALGASGTLLVKSDASSDDLSSFLSTVLTFATHIDQDLSTVSTQIGHSVSYQPETLMPNEVSQGIAGLTAATSQIRASTHGTSEPIMIGRRTETVASVAQAAGVLLVAYDASPTDIANAFNLLTQDESSAINQAITDAQALYTQSNVSMMYLYASEFGVTDTTSPASLAVVTSALQALEQAAGPARLLTDNITSVVSTTGTAGVTAYGSTYQLSVNFAALNEESLAQTLSDWENSTALANQGASRLSEQEAYVTSLGSKYTSVGFNAPTTAYDISSGEKTQALAAGAQAFEETVTSTELSQIGITTVTLVRSAPSVAESALVSADKTTLTVDLYAVTSAVLKQALNAAMPVTPPSPRPAEE